MNKRLSEVLTGREDNYMLPFYWQHGDHYEKIPHQVEQIFSSGCRALCVESRPHKDFCGETWWRDMDLIISEAEKRGMKVWILDDDHFPTGHAVGQVLKHPELRKWMLIEKHIDVMGPVTDSMIMIDNESDEHIILGAYALPRTGEGENCLPEPICLTEGVGKGFLQFSLPEGCWRVFVLYKTQREGSRNDYIDMLREESVKLLIDAVYEPHYAHYAKYFGNTIAGFFSDEPSLGNRYIGSHPVDYGMYDQRVGMPQLAMPWNDRIRTMMQEALGYDPLPYYPALWFDLGDVTPSLRHAYMDSVTKLYRDCFTRQLGDWCQAHNVEYIGHIIEDMNAHARLACSAGHYFRSLDGQHMSGIDVVLHQIIPGLSHYIHNADPANTADPAFFDYVLAKLASSFAHIGIQMKGRAMCEVFGAYGWAEGTLCMKWLLDHLLVRGVNHFVPHAFSPSFPDPDCPPHFGAGDKDPQFDGFSAIMRYGNKAAHMLSEGTHIADAAVLYHADAEWSSRLGGAMLMDVPAKILYDEHIDFDIIPADCLTEGSGSRVYHAEAENGRLRVGGETYGCLIIPAAEELPGDLVKALDRLRDSGVKIIRMNMNDGRDELLKQVDEAVERDITVKGGHPFLRCVHYRQDDSEVYMFVNESVADSVSADIFLRSLSGIKGGTVLDLLNDSIYSLPVKDRTISISLAPYQSVIAVFDHNDSSFESIPGRQEYSLTAADLVFDIEKASYEDMSCFAPYAEKVSSGDLPNITDIGRDPGFSGKIRYTARFERPDGVCGIDLGKVGQTVHLWCNGTDLGVRVCPPYAYDLSAVLKDGENVITAEVSNTLANALRDGFSRHLTMPASGLTGPVRWRRPI